MHHLTIHDPFAPRRTGRQRKHRCPAAQSPQRIDLVRTFLDAKAMGRSAGLSVIPGPCAGLCPGSSPRLALANADGWIPVTSTGITVASVGPSNDANSHPTVRIA